MKHTIVVETTDVQERALQERFEAINAQRTRRKQELLRDTTAYLVIRTEQLIEGHEEAYLTERSQRLAEQVTRDTRQQPVVDDEKLVEEIKKMPDPPKLLTKNPRALGLDVKDRRDR